MQRKIKVLTGKVGLDAHVRGINVVNIMLRDAGMEVIYIGPYNTPERVVETAVQEDVDVIGLSFYGAELAYAPQILKLLEEKGIKKDVLLIFGGVVPQVDVPILKEMGVDEVFRPGTTGDDIANFIRENVKRVGAK